MLRNRTPEQDQPRARRLTIAVLVLGLAVVLPTALSGATFTSSSKNTGSVSAAVDWTPPTVELVDPGDAVRGTITVAATATDGETGIASVALAWSPSGTGTWTTICTDTVAPYACALNTTTLPDDDIDLRAIATDRTGFTATDVIEGVLVDNTAPTGSVTAPSGTLSGAVVITATAADAGSGVASVAIQYATAGGSTWTTICTDVETPFSCRWDTTTVTAGLYDLRGIVTDVAGNTLTTALVRNKLVDNTISSVSVADPGTYLRGSVTISASANAVSGVASVRIQRQLVGGAWVDLCTDTTSPYSCAWDTTTVADGSYNLQAILIDNLTLTKTSATVGPVQVDNSPVRGVDVQGVNGGKANKTDAGDTITLTYSRTMRATSILPGWDGTARAVTVRFRDGSLLGLTGSDDTMDVFTSTAYSTAVNLGSVNLKANLVKGKKTVPFAATMTLQATTVNGVAASRVVVTLGAPVSGAGNLRSSSAKVAMRWTPSALAVDTTGVVSSTAIITESGTLDADW